MKHYLEKIERKGGSSMALFLAFLFCCSISSLEATSLNTQDISDKDIHGTYEGKAPAHFEKESWHFFADFLYWQAQEDNLDYAALEHVSGTSIKQKVEDLDQHWKPGFRLGTGYHFGFHDQWDLTAYWTYFRGTASDSSSFPGTTNVNTTGNGFLIPTWGAGILGSTLSKASAHWSVNLNLLDLELGRNFFASKAIAIRPYIGIRGASIDQDYTANYTAVFTLEDINGDDFDVSKPTRMRAHNDYIGMGPRLGADFIWHIGRHWGLLAKFSGSLLFGHFDVDQNFYGFSIDNTNDPFILNAAKFKWDDDFNRVRANLEESLGVQCEWLFRKWNFTVAVLYEFAQWFEQNQLRRTSLIETPNPDQFPIQVVESRESSDLGLSGVTLHLRFGF
jgi:hypothetical protein